MATMTQFHYNIITISDHEFRASNLSRSARSVDSTEIPVNFCKSKICEFMEFRVSDFEFRISATTGGEV